MGSQVQCRRTHRARRPIKEHALWGLDADAKEKLGVRQRELDALAKVTNLVVEPTDLPEAHGFVSLVFHVEDRWVNLGGGGFRRRQ